MERDERAVCELVLEDLEVGAQLVPLELRDVGLDVFVERDELREGDLVWVPCERRVAVVLDDIIGERHVVLGLDDLDDLVDVQLRAALRVLVKTLREPPRLLVYLFERRACIGRMPVRQPHSLFRK